MFLEKYADYPHSVERFSMKIEMTYYDPALFENSYGEDSMPGNPRGRIVKKDHIVVALLDDCTKTVAVDVTDVGVHEQLFKKSHPISWRRMLVQQVPADNLVPSSQPIEAPSIYIRVGSDKRLVSARAPTKTYG